MREPTAADLSRAREALLEITAAETIGEPAGFREESDGVTTVYFDTTMKGYVGWKWTVSLVHLDGAEPSVLETELTPAEGALLAPEWIPWSERLADYKELQAERARDGAMDDGPDDELDDGLDDDDDDGLDDELDDDALDDDDHDDDDDDSDDDDFDDDGALLHSGDLDGVDIDSLDESEVSEASALSAVSGDKSENTKGEPDDAGPQPPVKARRAQRSKKQQQHDEAE